jgi:hypothetical protein
VPASALEQVWVQVRVQVRVLVRVQVRVLLPPEGTIPHMPQ